MKTALNSFAELSFDETESLLCIKVNNEADLSIDSAKQHGEQIKQLTQNKPHLALIDISNFFAINEEALKYASVPANLENRVAAAYFNPDLANWLTVQIFCKFRSSAFPVQVFKTKQEALSWLKNFSLQN